MNDLENVFRHFYRTARAGAVRLSDGGGPFGFDIGLAVIIDELLSNYRCDVLIETGCFLGDTTTYLASAYPELPVFTCDIEYRDAMFTWYRTRHLDNVTVTWRDSAELVEEVCAVYDRSLCFLDAHWGPQWPLERELAALRRGVAVIHDFDIGHPRYSFDTYNGLPCGPDVLARMEEPPLRYYTPDPDVELPFPCLQTGRRAGTGIVAVGLDTEPLDDIRYLRRRTLETEPLA